MSYETTASFNSERSGFTLLHLRFSRFDFALGVAHVGFGAIERALRGLGFLARVAQRLLRRVEPLLGFTPQLLLFVGLLLFQLVARRGRRGGVMRGRLHPRERIEA